MKIYKERDERTYLFSLPITGKIFYTGMMLLNGTGCSVDRLLVSRTVARFFTTFGEHDNVFRSTCSENYYLFSVSDEDECLENSL